MTTDPYYIDPEDPDDMKKLLRDTTIVMFLLLVVLLLCGIYGCTTQRNTAKVDTLIVTKTDTFMLTDVKEKVRVEYRDRWRDNTATVNDKGDTIRIKEKEYIYVHDFIENNESINYYKAVCDSLKRTKQEVIIKEKELTWWQKFRQDTYIYILIAFLATICTAVIYRFYHNKKP